MNITIDGYVSYICSRCKEKFNHEAKFLTFEEDTSPESEDDEFIRYISQIDTPCTSCNKAMQVNLEVWEFPESVANYSYYSSQSVSAIECEFTIEHYFNDEVAEKEDEQDGPRISEPDEEDTEEKVFNEASSKVEGYTDQYDHED